MGGGDLNLKKSWHPHTLKNQEKVWKAEKAKSQEQHKLGELRKEIEEERNREELKRIGENSGVLAKGDGDKKLEWMYKNSNELINREEYLLGRTVDKSFEILQAEEHSKEQNLVGVKEPLNHVEHECIPFSMRSYKNDNTSTEQVDLQRKVLEDPLMLIKQREMESRRKLLENPVKLKELHRILKTDQMLKAAKQKKKSKKLKKSKRKHKKHKNKSNTETESQSDSVDDLDKELAKRYSILKDTLMDKEENAAGLNIAKLLDVKYETISKELDKAVKSKKSKKLQRSRSNSDEKGRVVDRSDMTQRHRREPSPVERRGIRNRERRQSIPRLTAIRHEHRRSRTSSPARRHERRRTRSRSPALRHDHRRSRTRTPTLRHERKRTKSRSPGLRHERRRFRSRSPAFRSDRRRSKSRSAVQHERKRSKTPLRHPHRPRHNPVSDRKRSPLHETKVVSSATSGKKLSEAEKEVRRREMMENAAWREADRTQAVQKHRDAYLREEESHKTRDFDQDFINKEIKKAMASQSSVGSRLRANVNNIQRTASAMDSNFAKK